MAAKSHIVPMDPFECVDIPLERPHEFLRVAWRGVQRGRFWEPSGPRDERDYIYVAHFRQWDVAYCHSLVVQPFYQYIVDLGHGYVLAPSEEKMPIPNRPDWTRCASWRVMEFVQDMWPEDVPIKQMAELLEPKRKAA